MKDVVSMRFNKCPLVKNIDYVTVEQHMFKDLNKKDLHCFWTCVGVIIKNGYNKKQMQMRANWNSCEISHWDVSRVSRYVTLPYRKFREFSSEIRIVK